MPLDERVLVIPEAHFQCVGGFEGFRHYDEAFARGLLDTQQFSFMARRVCESDPSFKQLIPYVVLTHGQLVFHYRRGAGGTEKRLAALRSVGIGGHISETDASGSGDPYVLGLERELSEEVTTAEIVHRQLLGFIYDPRTPVGQVHLGIVHRYELAAPKAAPCEDALAEPGFSPVKDLLLQAGQFETWSQFALKAL